METRKHWWGKTTHRKVHTNHGWCEEVKYYLFGIRGLCFLTELNHEPLIQEHEIKPSEKMDLEEITGYCEWRERMYLMRLSNDEFDMIINNR